MQIKNEIKLNEEEIKAAFQAYIRNHINKNVNIKSLSYEILDNEGYILNTGNEVVKIVTCLVEDKKEEIH